MTAKRKVEEAPGESNPDVLLDVDAPEAVVPDVPLQTIAGPVSVDEGPDEPMDDELDMSAYVDEPGKAVTMADVAALNGVGLAPDASYAGTVKASEVPFLSEGLRTDLAHQGWALDPLTGRKIVQD